MWMPLSTSKNEVHVDTPHRHLYMLCNALVAMSKQVPSQSSFTHLSSIIIYHHTYHHLSSSIIIIYHHGRWLSGGASDLEGEVHTPRLYTSETHACIRHLPIHVPIELIWSSRGHTVSYDVITEKTLIPAHQSPLMHHHWPSISLPFFVHRHGL